MTECLSVLLPTYNNEAIIRDCLKSVKWADEILVVDSFSTDSTIEICREYGAHVIQHEYVQSAKQKNWAIPQCAFEWVLQIDTDERLEEGAADEIRNAIGHADADIHAFRIGRRNHVLGPSLDVCNLYPDYQTRLFRRDVGRFEDREVHAHVRVPGRVETLQHHILHYGMTSISKQLINIDRYSRYQADELKKRGKHFHWYDLALRPFAVFAYYYLWKRGFTAGYRGLLISAIDATFDFWSHAKLWEMESQGLEASPK
ncbi:MAG: glycosyltransferase family 2 protein [Chloroflexi bacterium]|nr:glycosyltransferase family 2 protein [Chloroflexota bacterium]